MDYCRENDRFKNMIDFVLAVTLFSKFSYYVKAFGRFIKFSFNMLQIENLGPVQTSNFSCAESNANEKNLLFRSFALD